MLLHAADQGFLEMVELDRVVGDLAQRDDRVLVIVAVDRERRPRGDLARPLRGHEDQLEPVRNLDDAIFDGNSCHPLTFRPRRWKLWNIWGAVRCGNSKTGKKPADSIDF